MLPVTFDDRYHLMGRDYTSVTGGKRALTVRKGNVTWCVLSPLPVAWADICICAFAWGGVWECQTASAVAALCLPARPHDFWKTRPGRRHSAWREQTVGRPPQEPWSSDPNAEPSCAAHLSARGFALKSASATPFHPCPFSNSERDCETFHRFSWIEAKKQLLQFVHQKSSAVTSNDLELLKTNFTVKFIERGVLEVHVD